MAVSVVPVVSSLKSRRNADVSLDEIQAIFEPMPEQASKAGGWSDAEWTRAAKSGLCKLASAKGCDVCANRVAEAYWGEWLFDIVWLRVEATEERTVILDSPLVAECEWNASDGAIRHDFTKLLLARTDLRLMILQARDRERARTMIGGLVEQIQAYARSQSGDRYIFVCYCARDRGFDYREYVHS